MKIAILDVRNNPTNMLKTSTVAFRNLAVLKKELHADLYNSVKLLQSARYDYDAIICGFGSLTTEINNSTAFLIKNRKAELFWLVGEYEQSTFQPLFYSKRPYHIIKNFWHEIKNKQALSQTCLNINTLLAKKIGAIEPQYKYDMVYYGRWREGRIEYFRKYLQGGIHVSTSAKNMKKFQAYGCHVVFSKPMAWQRNKETLRLYRTSLYLEDIFTHTHYNFPSNRYYEALHCQSVVIPHYESKHTWEKAGIDMSARYIENVESMLEKIEEYRDPKRLTTLLDEQKEWNEQALREREDVILKLKHLLSSAIREGIVEKLA